MGRAMDPGGNRVQIPSYFLQKAASDQLLPTDRVCMFEFIIMYCIMSVNSLKMCVGAHSSLLPIKPFIVFVYVYVLSGSRSKKFVFKTILNQLANTTAMSPLRCVCVWCALWFVSATGVCVRSTPSVSQAAQPADVVTAQPADVVTAQPADVVTAQPADVVTAQPADVVTAQPTDVVLWHVAGLH